MLREKKIEVLLGRLLPKEWLYLKNTSLPGLPDRLIVAPNGVTYWVELKQPNGELSVLQEHQIKRLKALGHKVEVLWSETEVREWIKETT
jgi:G:T-mismatch repair DNA endonuclease (very short patch repair protein)